MKTITKLSYALILSLAVTLTSCSGDDDSGSTNNNNSSGEFVKAKVDGQNFNSSTSYDLVGASRPTQNAMAVQGSDNNGNAIQITLFSFDGEGTYDVSNQLIGQALYTEVVNMTSFISYSSAAGNGASGEVTITHVDDEKVEGTFSFTGRKAEEGSTEMVEVTNGEFRAKFQ